jgi:septum formation protein
MPSDVVEEEIDGEEPGRLSELLALYKARNVAQEFQDSVVIGADTIVVVGGDIFGKPRDRREAVEMIKRLSGREHRVITGLAVIKQNIGIEMVSHEVTKVIFRELTDREIQLYADSGEPMDKAGAYGIQGLGILLVKGIEGCYSNVVGLPLGLLAEMLRKLGYEPLLRGGAI